jgi:D-citramalate synthase
MGDKHGPLVPGHHWVSELNFDPELQQSFDFPKPLTVYDGTLRKILYVAGLRPSLDDLLQIATALEEIGVKHLMLNVMWWGDGEPDSGELALARAIFRGGFGFDVTVSTDALLQNPFHPAESTQIPQKEVVDMLMELGARAVSPIVGDLRDADARAIQRDQLAELFDYTEQVGASVPIILPDAGRFDFDNLIALCNEAIRLGTTRLDVMDSLSSLSPDAMKLFMRRLRSRLTGQVPMSMHVHNDFGLATGSLLAAITCGANPDVAVNGVSYRAGFASLEEIVVALEVHYGIDTGIRLDKLQAISDLVADKIGLPNHPLKPLTGAHAFMRDMPGLAIAYLNDGPDGFPPSGSCLAPSVVGATMRMGWGHRNCKGIIRTVGRTMGLSLDESQVDEVRRRLDARLDEIDQYPHWVEEAEVRAICQSVATSLPS